MTKLYSYVVRFDLGFAPNPFGGLCTLAKCKIGNKQRNIVEMVEVGDWIVGTGGADPRTSSGNGTLIYAMRVDKKTPLSFLKVNLPAFRGQIDYTVSWRVCQHNSNMIGLR